MTMKRSHEFDATITKIVNGKDIQVALTLENPDAATLAVLNDFKRQGIVRLTATPLQLTLAD